MYNAHTIWAHTSEKIFSLISERFLIKLNYKHICIALEFYQTATDSCILNFISLTFEVAFVELLSLGAF